MGAVWLSGHVRIKERVRDDQLYTFRVQSTAAAAAFEVGVVGAIDSKALERNITYEATEVHNTWAGGVGRDTELQPTQG